MKKNNKISQVFTEDGIVKIRFKKGKREPIHMVRNNTTLETLVAQQALSTPNEADSQTVPERTANNNNTTTGPNTLQATDSTKNTGNNNKNHETEQTYKTTDSMEHE